MMALVQSGTPVATQNNAGEVPFRVGQTVYLREEVSQLWVASYLLGAYRQLPYVEASKVLVHRFRGGLYILAVERLPVPFEGETAEGTVSSDLVLRFALPVGELTRAFPAWQFVSGH